MRMNGSLHVPCVQSLLIPEVEKLLQVSWNDWHCHLVCTHIHMDSSVNKKSSGIIVHKYKMSELQEHQKGVRYFDLIQQ